MTSSASIRSSVFVLALLAGSVAASANAEPLVNETYFTIGLRGSGGFFYQKDLPPKLIKGSKPKNKMPFGGTQVLLTVGQRLFSQISLDAEIYNGFLWLDDNTMTDEGWQKKSIVYNLGVDLALRYYPLPNLGFFAGASIGAQWIFIRQRYTAFLPSLRLGWAIPADQYEWRLEFGYTTPFIGGVSSDGFIVKNNSQHETDANASRMHQFFASVNFSF